MLNTRIDSGIAILEIDRPEVRNAFDGSTVRALLEALANYESDPSVQGVLLCSTGTTFCAGADLRWMASQAQLGGESNEGSAGTMASLFRRLDSYSKPVVCRVQGAAVGGGVGLVSCADIVVASESAKMGLSEVRLGIAPAVISPFVVRKIGESNARRYFLTGERFQADVAKRIGLVHEVVAPSELDEAVATLLNHLRKGGPKALQVCKGLARESNLLDAAEVVDQRNGELIARLRASEEGQEGLMAFLSKRPARWVPKGEE